MECSPPDSHNIPKKLAEPTVCLLWVETYVPEGRSDFPRPMPKPHRHTVSGLCPSRPLCTGSRNSPLTCHVSLESPGLGSVAVSRGPLRQQVDGSAKLLQGCAEVASLCCHHPLQLQGLGLLQLCSRENSICAREGARRGQVCSWEQEAKATWGFGNLGHEPGLTGQGCRSQQESDAVFGAGGTEVSKAES